MALLDNEIARRHDNQLETRPTPLRVRWELGDLFTADSNDLRCTFTCSVRVVDDSIERRMLQEVLMVHAPRVTDADVARHFGPTLKDAAAAAAKERGAEVWLGNDGKQPMIDALKSAAEKVAFACGLEVLAPFGMELESGSYRAHQLRDMQRKIAERQAAGQIEHMNRAAELLRQFQDLRQNAPELTTGRLLGQLNPADQGQMLQTLLLASAKQEQAAELWAVAGPYLVRIDARQDGPPRTPLSPLPPTLGPLRSVQPAHVNGERTLLIGARSGFMVYRPGSEDEPEMYPDPSIESQLGFSRVVYHGPDRGFVASHGEAGIVRWVPGRHAGPVAAFRPERFGERPPPVPGTPPPLPSSGISGSLITSRTPGPRNLQVLDEQRLIFSVANRVWILDNDDAYALPQESESEVAAIVPADKLMLIVHEDGTVCALDKETRLVACKENRGIRVKAAGALPWLGGTRLLLAGEEGAVQCVGTDDPLVTQYASPHRGLRVVAGSADLVAGVNADRQRIILWNTWDGRQPKAEVYITGLTKHRVADVDFG